MYSRVVACSRPQALGLLIVSRLADLSLGLHSPVQVLFVTLLAEVGVSHLFFTRGFGASWVAPGVLACMFWRQEGEPRGFWQSEHLEDCTRLACKAF